MLALAIPVADFNAYSHYRSAPAFHSRATAAEGRPLPYFGGSGTGGFEDVRYIMLRQGYSPFAILKMESTPAREVYAPYKDQMKEVKAGFGRTMSHLPAVFGVSRQTIYNWLKGETPKEQHQGKLVNLASAARVFINAGFKPTALSLDRTVANGKSFIELIEHGADGKEAAERLIRIERRGASVRAKLDALVGARSFSRPDAADMGLPAFNENV